MIKILFVLAGLVLGFAASGYAADRAEIARGYAGCVKFLKLSKAEQIRVARKTGFSHAKTLEGCRYMVRNGVEKTWRNQLPAPRPKPGRVSTPRLPERNPWQSPACSGSRDCGVGEHCIAGYCSATAYGCHTDGECVPGESCSGGVCVD